MSAERIPVSVLTGFLGSGKTTILRHLAQQGELDRTLILVNEFGEVGLDHQLLTPIDDDTLVAVESGCICCTIRADLVKTLTDAPWRYARGGKRWFDRVIIETTGIADPAPILQTILGNESVSAQYDLAAVITAVDAVNGFASLHNHLEAVKQVAVADRLLLTKTDLAGDDVVKLDRRLRELAPSAEQNQVLHGEAQAGWFFDVGSFKLDGKAAKVDDWLREEMLAAQHADRHTHDHPADPNRHGQIFASCLTFSEPVDAAMFEASLSLLLQFKGPDLLRIKGIVNVHGVDRPMVIHGVQHVFHPPQILDDWPSEDRRTRIVIIAKDLDHEQIGDCFRGFGFSPEGT
ncbi:MAG: GTP-binding protein [Pseudomonadota bacterium]